MKISAGIFLHNIKTKRFLILHPAGWYNKKAAWSIPKGEIDKELPEDPAAVTKLLKETALRELKEETGISYGTSVAIKYLGEQKYVTGKKILHAFFLNTGVPEAQIKVVMKDGENDDFKWVRVEELADYVHEAQIKFLPALLKLI